MQPSTTLTRRSRGNSYQRLSTTYTPVESSQQEFLTPILPGLKIRLSNNSGVSTLATVRKLSAQDLVLVVNDPHFPAVGDVVSLTIYEDDQPIVSETSGLIHWQHEIADHTGERTIAAFCVKRLDEVLHHRIRDDRRVELRFPTDLPARMRLDSANHDVRVVDYSLHGVAILCRESLELNKRYILTDRHKASASQLSAEVQWQRRTANGYLAGCALASQHGVILSEMIKQHRTQNQTAVLPQNSDGNNPYSAPVSANPTGKLRKTDTDYISGNPEWNSSARHITPVLSALLIALSIQWTGAMKTPLLLTGLIGVIASIGLNVISDCRTYLTDDKAEVEE